MTAFPSGEAGLRLVLLLCLDTLEITDGPNVHAPPPPWARNAARLLEHARGQGWMVAHILRLRPTGSGRWCDAFGLSPRLDERVFHREQASAFSTIEFLDIAPPSAELVILGRSVDGALLRTAREGLAMGFAIAVADDAIAAPVNERAHLADLARAGPQMGGGRLALQGTPGLQAARPPLRLIEGGRAGVVRTASHRSGGAHEL